jgi:hypothetical protein
VSLREFSITPYRSSLPAGKVVFNSTNFGEDRHNLKITGPRRYRSAESPDVEPFGGRGRFVVRLRRPGTYTLICTIADHFKLGMKTRVRVRAH